MITLDLEGSWNRNVNVDYDIIGNKTFVLRKKNSIWCKQNIVKHKGQINLYELQILIKVIYRQKEFSWPRTVVERGWSTTKTSRLVAPTHAPTPTTPPSSPASTPPSSPSKLEVLVDISLLAKLLGSLRLKDRRAHILQETAQVESVEDDPEVVEHLHHAKRFVS